MAISQRPYGPGPGNPSGLNPVALNSVAAIPGQGSAVPASVIGSVTTEQVIPNAAVPTIALIAALSNETNLEQIPFKISASGIAVVNALTTTLTIKLYSGSSLVALSNSLLRSSGAITPTRTFFNWFLEGTAQFNSVGLGAGAGGSLEGFVKFMVNNQVVADAAFSNVPLGIFNSLNPVFQAVLSAQFSAANSANLFQVQAFTIG